MSKSSILQELRVLFRVLPALIILALLGGVTIFYLPLNPVLTVTFRISQGSPELLVVSSGYSRISLYSSSGIVKGEIELSGAQPGPYRVRIVVSYANQTLGGTKFDNIGTGVLQARVVYAPGFYGVQESSNVPYLVLLILVNQGNYRQLSNVTVAIYPSI